MQDEQGKSGTNRGVSSNQPIKRGCKKPIKRTDFITLFPPKQRPGCNVPKQTSKAQLRIRNCAASLDWFQKAWRPAQRYCCNLSGGASFSLVRMCAGKPLLQYVVLSVLRNRFCLPILIWRDRVTNIRPCRSWRFFLEALRFS